MNDTPMVMLIRAELALPVVHCGLFKLLDVLELLDELGVGTAVAPPPLSVLSLLLELESDADALVELSVEALWVVVELPEPVSFFLPPESAKTPPTITATTTTAAMMP